MFRWTNSHHNRSVVKQGSSVPEPVGTPKQTHKLSRREFIARGSAVAATSALAGVSIPWVHAAEDNTIRLALIGCGGRGSGAVADAFDSPDGPVKLVAMADLFENRLDRASQALSEKFSDQVDVPPDRRFLGFDAYRKAIDCLRPGDVAMLTGYAGFRPAQLEYAVEKGVNVFMEKSFAADPPAAAARHQGRRSRREEEPQDRRGPAVPPLP